MTSRKPTTASGEIRRTAKRGRSYRATSLTTSSRNKLSWLLKRKQDRHSSLFSLDNNDSASEAIRLDERAKQDIVAAAMLPATLNNDGRVEPHGVPSPVGPGSTASGAATPDFSGSLMSAEDIHYFFHYFFHCVEKLLGLPKSPLTAAISKTGRVRYKDSTYLKKQKSLPEEQRGTLSTEELRLLREGSPDIRFANCTTFIVWALARAGYEITTQLSNDLNVTGLRPEMRKAWRLRRKLKEEELGRELNKEEAKAERQRVKREVLKKAIQEGDARVKGAAYAFERAGIGTEIVGANNVRPGDFAQTFGPKGGGHATIVHRVHCLGDAIFGQHGSPHPKPLGSSLRGLHRDVKFILDENTRPATVVAVARVLQLEHIGAHTKGRDSTGTERGASVFTRMGARRRKSRARKKDKKTFTGGKFFARLHSSPWAAGRG